MNFNQELRYLLIEKVVKRAEYRKRVLKVERFYFNQNIDGIESFHKLLLNSNNQPISFVDIKSATLRKILNFIENGDIYGWIEYKGSRCKIKPKKIDKQ